MIIPIIIAGILGYALVQRVDIFSVFTKGAKEGISVSIKILPALIALITAIGMFKTSGALDVLTNAIRPFAEKIHMPSEVVPLAILRPISGSGAFAVFEDILSTHGADSLIGRIASVLEGSSETTFYTIALYFGCTRVKKTRYTLPCSLTADFVGFLMSVITVRMFFGMMF